MSDKGVLVNQIIHGDCLEVMRSMPDGSVDCVVTSPPYWGLRNYGVEGQLGLEKTPEEYVAKVTTLFREVRRVLRNDGTLWLNLGDSYWNSNGFARADEKWQRKGRNNAPANDRKMPKHKILKIKDLAGIPWRVAFALQADGWYLRSDIIWHKPNPMPESVTDRPTKSHEYIFLMSKSPKYYYDAEAIKEPGTTKENRPFGIIRDRLFEYDSKESILRNRNKDGRKNNSVSGKGEAHASGTRSGGNLAAAYRGVDWSSEGRNKRDVWTVQTTPLKEAHFATFPPKLIEPCILAGCPEGGVVLDPFMGAGTTAIAALKNNRQYLGIELNPEYIKIAEKRLAEYMRQGVLI